MWAYLVVTCVFMSASVSAYYACISTVYVHAVRTKCAALPVYVRCV